MAHVSRFLSGRSRVVLFSLIAALIAGVAQSVEQLICNQQVGGSNPSTSSNGGVPERPKGADCKSVVSDFDGSNPSSPTNIKTPVFINSTGVLTCAAGV